MRRAVVGSVIIAWLACIIAAATTPQATAATARVPHRVSYDRHALLIDDAHVAIVAGEFHYWRLPSPGLWRDVLQKLHAEGFNAVSIYFDWAYHSSAPGSYDFHGIRDIDLLLDMASQEGLYVIARPGPYINAETDSGGFPGWLETQKGVARTSAPDYLAAARDWYRRVDRVIARHQLTDGRGSVILYQIENEYIGKTADRSYMAALEKQARADGIVVPLTANSCCGDGGHWNRGTGAVDINGYDSYPQGFDCTHPDRWDIYDPAGEFADTRKALGPTKPFFLTEYQGGANDGWGGPGYDACRRMTEPAFIRVFEEYNLAAGATLQNFYMGYGGTSWGWLPSAEAVYTSYDYGAGIGEARDLTAKYGTQKLLGNEIRTLTPLVTAHAVAAPHSSNPAVHLDARRDDATQTQFFIARHADITAATVENASFAVTVDGRPYTIPVSINGRDSKIITGGFMAHTNRIAYTTSEIMSVQTIGGTDVVVLFGRDGETGETVLRSDGSQYASEIFHAERASPSDAVRIIPGSGPNGARHPIGFAMSGYSSVRIGGGDTRLRYRYGSLMTISTGTGASGNPLLLLIGSDATAAEFWPQNDGGAVLVRGPELVRSATVRGDTLALTGDTIRETQLSVFVPKALTRVTWNGTDSGALLRTSQGGLIEFTATLPGPAPVTLPVLTDWKRKAGSPESAPAFDDRTWTRATHIVTNNPNKPHMSPVLYADDYGFHYGDVWYRGRFVTPAARSPKSVTIDAGTGHGGTFSVWLNGAYLGSQNGDADGRAQQTFALPRGTLHAGQPATIAVLLENAGHNEDFSHTDSHKRVRGIRALRWGGAGRPPRIDWRVAGNRENDPVRGPLNAGGQFGERFGWYLPGYDDSAWEPAAVPSTHASAGVAWYRTQFALRLPADQDVAVGLRIDDTPARPYRALIYLNGWLVGRYINDLGPQTRFVLPGGILHTRGLNTLAISTWNHDPKGTDLGTLSLEVLDNMRSPLRVPDVASPSYRDLFAPVQ